MLDLIHDLSHWQICGLVIWLLLQGTVLAVAPEEIIFLSLGVLWSQGRVGFAEALTAALLGLLPANAGMVFVAGRFRRNSLVQKASVQRALELVRAKGRWMIFITRFTPLVRAPVYASVGLSGMSVLSFFKVDAPAALIQVPLLILAGAWIEETTGSIESAYKVIGIGAATVAVIIVSVFWVREKRRKKATLS